MYLSGGQIWLATQSGGGEPLRGKREVSGAKLIDIAVEAKCQRDIQSAGGTAVRRLAQPRGWSCHPAIDAMTGARRIPNPAGGLIRVTGGNRAAHYARYWLELLGEDVTDNPSAPIVITGKDDAEAPCIIRLWDNQVGMAGDGVFASALSGAATVHWPG